MAKSTSLFDLEALRKKIFDKYGATAQGFDPTAGMTDNPVEDPFASIPDIRPPVGPSPTPDFQEMMGDFDTSKQDAYNRLLAQRPEREDPGILRRIVAAGMSVGAHPGDVKDPLEVQESVMYAPHARKMKDWAAQVDPAYKAAQLENTTNTNERQARTSTINARNAADKLIAHERDTQAQIASKEKIAAEKIALQKEKDNGAQVSFSNGHAIVHKLDGTIYEAPVDLTNYSALEIAQLTADAAQKRTETQGATARDVAEIGATSRQGVAETNVANRELFNVPDDKDPTKMIFKRYNSDTNQMEIVPDKDTGKPTGAAQRPGTGSGGGGKLIQPVNIAAIQDMARETLQALSKLIDEKDQLTPVMKEYYGKPFANQVVGELPLPTNARIARTQHKRAMDLLVVELIGEMKNQSRTGATGFGQLSIPELAILQSAANGIDVVNKPEVTLERLKEIRAKVSKILQPPDSNTPTITSPRSTVQQAIDKIMKGETNANPPR